MLPSMTKIGLGSILRAMFGADGPALDELRDLLPPMVLLGEPDLDGAAEDAP